MTAPFAPNRSLSMSRREVVAGLALLGAAGVAAMRRPEKSLNFLGGHKLEDIIPKRIGPWQFVTTSGLVVPPEDQLALTVYSQTLTRVYSDGKVPIWLLIAYSADQTGFLQVHRPEFCYSAAGYALSDFAPHRIEIGPSKVITTNSLTAVRDNSVERLIYWTRIGHHIPRTWTQQKFTVAEDNLRGFVPDASLIRISTAGVDEKAAMQILDEFVKALVASVPGPLRPAFVA